MPETDPLSVAAAQERRFAVLQVFVEAGRAAVTRLRTWFTESRRGKGRWSGRGGGGRAAQTRQTKKRIARENARSRRLKIKDGKLKPRRPIPNPKPTPRG